MSSSPWLELLEGFPILVHCKCYEDKGFPYLVFIFDVALNVVSGTYIVGSSTHTYIVILIFLET